MVALMEEMFASVYTLEYILAWRLAGICNTFKVSPSLYLERLLVVLCGQN